MLQFWSLILPFCSGRRLRESSTSCSHGFPYEPGLYNQPNCPPFQFCSQLGIQEMNNCYSYAINDLQSPRDPYHIVKPMPGDYRGEFLLPFQFDCPDLIGKITRDFPSIHAISQDQVDSPSACPCGSYKVLLLLDSEGYKTLDGRDFHLTRQDDNGMWSHKIGSAPVTNLDALNHTISDPYQASWNYSLSLEFGSYYGHAYTPCPGGLFCVPQSVATTARELRRAQRESLEAHNGGLVTPGGRSFTPGFTNTVVGSAVPSSTGDGSEAAGASGSASSSSSSSAPLPGPDLSGTATNITASDGPSQSDSDAHQDAGGGSGDVVPAAYASNSGHVAQLSGVASPIAAGDRR